ncbi:beta-ketoacyl synthase [bacterium]|nr:beta-ketoacyl synthase [bacterium]
MSKLPVIVGFGGINGAGRTSFHHGYRRYIIDRLNGSEKIETYVGLATLMGMVSHNGKTYVDQQGVECLPEDVINRFGGIILENTLLRRVGKNLFDADRVLYHKKIKTGSCDGKAFTFQVLKKELPNHLPENWKLMEIPDNPDSTRVLVEGSLEMFLPDERELKVKAASQLPTGFDPAKLYNSNHHPRGLQMAVFAATDAIYSMGIDWERIKDVVEPDRIGVYASSGMGQLDATGNGGMMKAGVTGQRTSSKQLAMGLVQMPADFINAYVLGNVGHTSAQVGACATFLYNLSAAVKDIQTGKRRVAIVGNSEAPLIPEIFEGYRAMSALGEDTQLLKLETENKTGIPDYSKACRPFSQNCGFALGESAQYFVLFDDELAVELGARVFGSIGDVFINADGFKKSISSPGFGNNISLAKSLALARSIIGERSLRNHTFISAHGTGTPQNRTTESFSLNEIAKVFGIESWPVSATKCYTGHSLGTASGDQLAAILGTWEHGIIPGIFTLDEVAEDVHQSNLLFSKEHLDIGKSSQHAAFINSKGFGGNNGTGVILSPETTQKMLLRKHGHKKMNAYQERNSSVVNKADEYNREAIKGKIQPIYHFDKDVLEEKDLNLTDKSLTVPGFKKPIDLMTRSPYMDMLIHEP